MAPFFLGTKLVYASKFIFCTQKSYSFYSLNCLFMWSLLMYAQVFDVCMSWLFHCDGTSFDCVKNSSFFSLKILFYNLPAWAHSVYSLQGYGLCETFKWNITYSCSSAGISVAGWVGEKNPKMQSTLAFLQCCYVGYCDRQNAGPAPKMPVS